MNLLTFLNLAAIVCGVAIPILDHQNHHALARASLGAMIALTLSSIACGSAPYRRELREAKLKKRLG